MLYDEGKKIFLMLYNMRIAIALLSLLLVPFSAFAAFGDTSTYFSKIYYGDGKDRLEALFDFPTDITTDGEGGFVIADQFNNVVRRVNANGVVSTVAGTGAYGDVIGTSTVAEFGLPKGVAVGDDGAVYVADTDNDKVKKIKGGTVSTIAEGLNGPEGVAVDGSNVYIADTGNNALKKVSTSGGTVTEISTSLSSPKKLSLTSDGKYAYIANDGSNQIKRVDVSSGIVTTIAGTGEEGAKNGSCAEATFENVYGVHLSDSSTLFVSDGDGFDDGVRKIDLDGCTVEQFAIDSAMLSINFPNGLTSHDGSLYVAATGIGIIEKYDLTDADVHETFAGANRFNVKEKKPALTGNPKVMVLSKNKKTIYYTENNRIRSLKRSNKKVSPLLVGSVVDNYNADDTVTYFGADGRFSDASGLVLSKDGKKLYVVDRNNNRIREVDIATGGVSYLTGAGLVNTNSTHDNGYADGVACPNEFEKAVSGCAYFNRPIDAVLSKDGHALYVSDSGNNRIRKVIVSGENKGKVTTVAGSGSAAHKDGIGTVASFNAPIGITRSKAGKFLLVVDRNNQVIRRVNTETKEVTTAAGKAGVNGYEDAIVDKAVFSYPERIARWKNNQYFVSEVGGSRIRLVDFKNGVTKLVAGSGTRGLKNGSRDVAKFNNPKGMLVVGEKLLVAELYNDLIRSISIAGTAPFTEVAPQPTSVAPATVPKEWFPSSNAYLEVYGTGFRYGATVYFGEHEAVKTYVHSSTRLVVEVPVPSMSAGYYTVRVKNTDGQTGDDFRGFALSQNGSTPVKDYFPE